VTVWRYREGVCDTSLITYDFDFLHEALDECPSFRQIATIDKLTQVLNIIPYYFRTR
jgi:hypothetical protein